MFFMIFSVLVLTCIALLPVLSDPEERRVWFTRLCLCRGWRARGQDEPEGCVSLKRSLCVDATHTYGTRLHTYVLVPSIHSLTHSLINSSRSHTRESQGHIPGSEDAHYILSPLQEEEIRESFIKDRLEAYSMVRIPTYLPT